MFSITDLMVNLAAQANAAVAPQLFCAATCRVCTNTCYDTCYGSCGFYSGGCGRSICSICGESTILQVQAPAGDPAAQLKALKEHLQLAVQQIEKQEQSLSKKEK